ncbi:MAG: dihydrofolate reductase [Alphaproteobacteria bacterium]
MTTSPAQPDASKGIEMIAVVAMAKNRVIGDGAGLIWHLPDDLKRVKALTMGCPLIMGRKTWDSIGRPLPGRASIVLTRDAGWTADGAVTTTNLDAAIAASKDWIAETDDARNAIILFGGGQIYEMGLSLCNRIELTVIDAAPDGGADAALFPDLAAEEWTRTITETRAATDDVPGFRYETLIRKSPVFV